MSSHSLNGLLRYLKLDQRGGLTTDPPSSHSKKEIIILLYNKAKVQKKSDILNKKFSPCSGNIHQFLPAPFPCQPKLTETHWFQRKVIDADTILR